MNDYALRIPMIVLALACLVIGLAGPVLLGLLAPAVARLQHDHVPIRRPGGRSGRGFLTQHHGRNRSPLG